MYYNINKFEVENLVAKVYVEFSHSSKKVKELK